MNTKEFLLTAWNWSPFVILVCIAAIGGYLLAFGRQRRMSYLVLGTTLFFLILASPLNLLADRYLFSAHMLQHIILLLIIPPLILLSLPQSFSLAGFKKESGFMRTLFHPATGWICGVGAMWVWHVPALCTAAVTVPWVKVLEIITLLAAGLLFWRPLLDHHNDQRVHPLGGALYLFTACSGCSLLGICITFIPVEICSVYLTPVDTLGIDPMIKSWGFTPANDQQIGGLLMWIPCCALYATGVMAQLASWYGSYNQPAPAAVGTKH